MVEIAIINQKTAFLPGDLLECEYRISDELPETIRAVETSVLWFTQGKGDEDLGVHFFKRRLRREMADKELEKVHRFSTELPRSPMSYAGAIVQIQWCIRVRLFFKKKAAVTFDCPFRLGQVWDPPQEEQPQGDNASDD